MSERMEHRGPDFGARKKILGEVKEMVKRNESIVVNRNGEEKVCVFTHTDNEYSPHYLFFKTLNGESVVVSFKDDIEAGKVTVTSAKNSETAEISSKDTSKPKENEKPDAGIKVEEPHIEVAEASATVKENAPASFSSLSRGIKNLLDRTTDDIGQELNPKGMWNLVRKLIKGKQYIDRFGKIRDVEADDLRALESLLAQSKKVDNVEKAADGKAPEDKKVVAEVVSEKPGLESKEEDKRSIEVLASFINLSEEVMAAINMVEPSGNDASAIKSRAQKFMDRLLGGYFMGVDRKTREIGAEDLKILKNLLAEAKNE